MGITAPQTHPGESMILSKTRAQSPALPSLLATFLGCLVLALACATPPDKYTAADVQRATESGDLSSLYDQIETDLTDPALSEGQRQTMELRLSEAGRALAQGAEQEIEAAVGSGALPDGLVPLEVYAAQKSLLASIERWDAAAFQRASSQLSDGENRTQDAISAKEAALKALTASQVEEKLTLYAELGALHGSGTDEQAGYVALSATALRELSEAASEAIQNEEYSEAQQLLEIVAAANPQDAAVEGQLVEVDAKLFELRFYDALEQDRPDDAYEALVTLSESSNFEKVKPRLTDTGDVMADYFVALGSQATESGNYTNAFRWFSQSRDIRDRLGLKNSTNVPEEQPFVNEMHARFKRATAKDLHGLAWGYLNVITELRPDAPSLRRELRETREKVLQKAVKRVSAAAFEDHHRGDSEFGDTVTAKIVQYLFETLSEDVRIIEREKLAEIEKERGLSKDATALIAVDYLIQGNVLEAKVDTSERSVNQRKRVVTGRETVPNPEWDRWNSMKEGERERAGLEIQPPRTIEREKVEDIKLVTTYHRKVGVFSVSYRVIDANTAKVLFADTQRIKRELTDTDSDGIELGDFKQEQKIANLPSTVEILDQLAEDVSRQCGEKLAAVLVDPEVQYEKNADRFVREGNYIDASQQYAYAVVLSDRKEKDATALRTNLRSSSVAATLD